MRRSTIILISVLCVAFLIFSFAVPAFAASVNIVDKVPQVNIGHEFNDSKTAPQLRIKEKNAGDFSDGDYFELALTNAEWLEDEITTAGAVDVIRENAKVDVDYISKKILGITINNITGTEEVEIRIPLLTKITAEGEARITVDPRDSAITGGTYVFAVSAEGKTVTTIEKIEEFFDVGNLAAIRIDETRIGALGYTTGQSIKLKLPPNFTWSKADEANFHCSGGLNDTVIKYKDGLNTRTLELSYDPTPFRSARGSILLQGLQIQADRFAPCNDVVLDIEGTNVTAAELIVAKRVIGSLDEAHLVGTITGTKKFPAIGIWEYECNFTDEIWALELSVIEETNDGSISRNFTTVGSYSGAWNDGEGFQFIHASEMKMLIGELEHTVYAFARGDVSIFEVAFLPDTEDSRGQFLSIFGLDHQSALDYTKGIIADSDDIVYGIPTIIYLQGQLVSPIVPPYLIQVSANSAVGGTVTGYGNYKHGNNITVIATPNSGYKFDNWVENGTVVSTSTAYTFTVTGNRKLTANFSKIPSPPSSGGSGGGGNGGGSGVTQEQEKKPWSEIAAVVEAELINQEITTQDDGKTIEFFTLREEAKEHIEKARKEGKTALEIKIGKSEASVVAVSVPEDLLKSADGMNLTVNTHHVTLELPKELVRAITALGQDLSIQVESGDAATVSELMADVAEAAGAEVLGTPTVINTGIRGNTNVSIPLSGIEIPKTIAEQQSFLDTLRIFAVHSDGEKKVIEGTIKYDAADNPVSINFTVDKFSTFAVISMPEVAKIGPLEVKLIIDQLKAIVNGESRILDTEPFIKPGINRTMVPIRFISEDLGVEVIWVGENKQVILKDPNNIIILTIDSDKVLVNNREKNLDCPAEILPPGRTFVPLRFVSENLGAKVFYDTKKREITITR
jgi:hypothetical protein